MDRYSRQLGVFGTDGQKKLKGSTISVVGAGGLGSSALMYLASAGVGRIRIIDDEDVEISNLNRQVLYTVADVGRKKSEAAVRRLGEMNDEISLESFDSRVDADDAASLISGSDVVLDCLDNWETRFVLNRACVDLGIPLVHGAVEGMNGQLMVVFPGVSACLACIFSAQKNRDSSVAGPVAGLIGCMEASEAIKIITKKGKSLEGEILLVNLGTDEFHRFRVSRNERCEVCG